MVLGSSLKPLMDLGLPSFSLLQAQVFYFYGVQFSVPFWALVQHCNFLDLNTKLKKKRKSIMDMYYGMM